jgi:hypothetical protein
VDVPWIPSLPVGGFVKRNKYRNHYLIGLKVTITGKHPFHGYNAAVCEIGDVGETGPLSFIVEVDATHRLEKIAIMNLAIQQCVLVFMAVTNVFNSQLYFRNEYHSWWVSWATKKFGFGFVQPSVKIQPPPLSLAPPTPLVPSTPIPEGLIFGSPAWQPSSRTPERSLDEQEGLCDRHDTHFVPLPPHRRIQKPPGKAGRSVGWLQRALKVDSAVFTQMRVSPNGRH